MAETQRLLNFVSKLAELSRIIRRGISSALQARFSKGAHRLLRPLLAGVPCDGADRWGVAF